MRSGRIQFVIEIDRETDAGLREWAELTERSRKRHTAILVRRLVKRWREKRHGRGAR